MLGLKLNRAPHKRDPCAYMAGTPAFSMVYHENQNDLAIFDQSHLISENKS